MFVEYYQQALEQDVTYRRHIDKLNKWKAEQTRLIVANWQKESEPAKSAKPEEPEETEETEDMADIARDIGVPDF